MREVRNPEISQIVLAGFMGAGKSTVGRLLAGEIGWRFFDSDEEIERGRAQTIAEIFSQRGEAFFRQIEAAVLRDLLSRKNVVVALGGGALESEETRTLLLNSEGTFVVFLDAPLDVLLSRCEEQSRPAIRPLLLERERLQERFARRLPYFRGAHLTVPTSHLSASAAAARIAHAIAERGKNT